MEVEKEMSTSEQETDGGDYVMRSIEESFRKIHPDFPLSHIPMFPTTVEVVEVLEELQEEIKP